MTYATRTLDGVDLPAAGTWRIDPGHAEVGSAGRPFGLTKVRGRFTGVAGAVTIADDVARSSVAVEIDMASVSSGDQARDDHLRSADFFDVEQFPLLTFVSDKIERAGDDLEVTGALTIRGITREITLKVEQLGATKDPWGNQRVAFAAKGSLDRKEFGLHWNQVLEAGGFVVGDKVELTLDVQAVQQSAQAAA